MRIDSALAGQVGAPHDTLVGRHGARRSLRYVVGEVVPGVRRRRHLRQRSEQEPARPLGDDRTGIGARCLERQPIVDMSAHSPELLAALTRRLAQTIEDQHVLPGARRAQPVDDAQQLIRVVAFDRLAEIGHWAEASAGMAWSSSRSYSGRHCSATASTSGGNSTVRST